MIVDLPNTTTSKVSKKIISMRELGGVVTLGVVAGGVETAATLARLVETDGALGTVCRSARAASANASASATTPTAERTRSAEPEREEEEPICRIDLPRVVSDRAVPKPPSHSARSTPGDALPARRGPATRRPSTAPETAITTTLKHS